MALASLNTELTLHVRFVEVWHQDGLSRTAPAGSRKTFSRSHTVACTSPVSQDPSTSTSYLQRKGCMCVGVEREFEGGGVKNFASSHFLSPSLTAISVWESSGCLAFNFGPLDFVNSIYADRGCFGT